MKNYHVFESGQTFAVVEQATEQQITAYPARGKAKQTANFLNGGNGFNGWTPPFILRGIR